MGAAGGGGAGGAVLLRGRASGMQTTPNSRSVPSNATFLRRLAGRTAVVAAVATACLYVVRQAVTDPGENHLVFVNASSRALCEVVVEMRPDGWRSSPTGEGIRGDHVKVVTLPSPFPAKEIAVRSHCGQFRDLVLPIPEGRAGHAVIVHYPESGTPEAWLDRMPPAMAERLGRDVDSE